MPGINDGLRGFVWLKFMEEGLKAGLSVGCDCFGGTGKYRIGVSRGCMHNEHAGDSTGLCGCSFDAVCHRLWMCLLMAILENWVRDVKACA